MVALRDPKKYGLPSKTVVEEIDAKTIALVINRKSRIILADGRKILAKVVKMKAVEPEKRVVVKTTAPVCSKTRAFLEEEGIGIILAEK